MQIVFGIDFGTTNSALSVYQNGTVEVVAVDGIDRGGELLRSVLYFNEDMRSSPAMRLFISM